MTHPVVKKKKKKKIYQRIASALALPSQQPAVFSYSHLLARFSQELSLGVKQIKIANPEQSSCFSLFPLLLGPRTPSAHLALDLHFLALSRLPAVSMNLECFSYSVSDNNVLEVQSHYCPSSNQLILIT